MIKLKDEYKDTLIYVPFINRDVVGKFIDEGLYPFMNEKYPELFEEVVPVVEKKKVKNDNIITDTEQSSDSDFGGEINE